MGAAILRWKQVFPDSTHPSSPAYCIHSLLHIYHKIRLLG